MSKESYLIEQILKGNSEALEDIYIQYKKEFFLYASRFSITEEDIVDIYQDSVVVLYENIKSGKLTTFTSSVKTYLFAIGKYKIYDRLKLKLKTSPKDFSDYEFLLKDEKEEVVALQQENINKMQSAFQDLGDKCKQVLKLFYYENQSIEEIKNHLDYASKDVVKSQKSRCLKQLKELMLKKK